MTDKELIKEEIERLIDIEEETSHLDKLSFNSGRWKALTQMKAFIDSLPEGFCCKIGLTAENENKIFEEIDRYCTLCMDINCFGCQYHDIHFRNIIKNDTIH